MENDGKLEIKGLSEEQTGLVKKLEESGFDWNKHPSIEGMIKDSQKERDLRHNVEDQIQKLRDENELLQNELADVNKEEPENKGETELEKLADGDFITAKQAKDMLEKAAKKGEVAMEEQEKVNLKSHLSKSEIATKEIFTAEKVGEGLDYETVIEQGWKPAVKKNPGLAQAMIRAEKPAEFAYLHGLQQPIFKSLVDEKRNQKLVEELNKNPGSPKGGGGVPEGSIVDSNFEALLEKSDLELDAMLQEAEETGK